MPTTKKTSKISTSVPSAPTCDTTEEIDNYPGSLVGRRIECWWEGDKEWYPGTFTLYDPDNDVYKLTYDDGEIDEGVKWPSEELRLAEQAPEEAEVPRKSTLTDENPAMRFGAPSQSAKKCAAGHRIYYDSFFLHNQEIHVGSCVWMLTGESKPPVAIQVEKVFEGGGTKVSNKLVGHRIWTHAEIFDVANLDVGDDKEAFISTRETSRPLAQVLGPCNALCSHKAGAEFIDEATLAAANYHYARSWCDSNLQAKDLQFSAIPSALECAVEFLKKRRADPSLAQQ
eukprot:gene1317-1908_t